MKKILIILPLLVLILFISGCPENYYRVIYHGNNQDGGTPPYDGNSYGNGNIATVLGNTGNLVKDNHVFGGWKTSPDAVNAMYQQGDEFKILDYDVTLYAYWIPVSSGTSSTVTYLAPGAGGSVPEDNTEYGENDSVTVAGNTGNLEREGYEFAGGSTEPGGEGEIYQGGDTFPAGTSDVNLYAHWIEVSEGTVSTITYSAPGAGGSVPVDNNEYGDGDSVTVAGNTGTLVMEGHEFAGWTTDPEGEGIIYEAGDPYTIGTSDVTFYAKWNELPPAESVTIGDYMEADLAEIIANPSSWVFLVAYVNNFNIAVTTFEWYIDNILVDEATEGKDYYDYLVPAFTEAVTKVAKVIAREGDKVAEDEVEIHIAPPAAAPLITPGGLTGGAPYEYIDPPVITMESSTQDKQIYYTTDGSEPTTESIPYEGELTLPEGTTVLKAITVATGHNISEVTTRYYQKVITAPEISINRLPEDNDIYFNNLVTVDIAKGDPANTVRWGSSHTTTTFTIHEGSTEYIEPILLGPSSSSTTYLYFKAKEFGPGGAESTETMVTLRFRVAAPVFTPSDENIIYNPTDIFAATDTDGADVRYVEGGSSVSSSSPVWTDPIEIRQDKLFNTRAYKDLWYRSPSSSGDYDIRVGTPELEPLGGTFNAAPVINLTSLTLDAVFYINYGYNAPDTSDPGYIWDGNPIEKQETGYVTVIAKSPELNNNQSILVRERYELKIATPIVSPPGGTFSSPQEITITIDPVVDGVQFYYNTNGYTGFWIGHPDAHLYDPEDPPTLDADTDLAVKGYKDGWDTSDPVILNFTFEF